jgi:hypothetical protein
MTDDEYQPVAVSRRVCAPAHGIFQVLADPVRHPELDGSGMLRGAVGRTDPAVSRGQGLPAAGGAHPKPAHRQLICVHASPFWVPAGRMLTRWDRTGA